MSLKRRDFLKMAAGGMLVASGARQANAQTACSLGSRTETPKRVFVSDVHMGAGRSLNKKECFRYDWLGKGEAAAFAGFLKYINSKSTVTEVVLLGDLFDTWVYPIYEKPVTYEEILKADHTQEIKNNLRALNKKVFYVPGNHDMSVSEKENLVTIKREFPNIELPGEQYCTNDGICAEHGHRQDIFNAKPDDGDLPYPFGHFISRLMATIAAAGKADYYKKYWDFRGNALAALKKNGMSLKPIFWPAAILDALAKELIDTAQGNLPDLEDENLKRIAQMSKEKTDDIPIKMLDGTDLPIGVIKQKYLWMKKYDMSAIMESAKEEFGARLERPAENLAATTGKQIVILGHSHKKKLKYLVKAVNQDYAVSYDRYALYANSGAWCESEKDDPFTFVTTALSNKTQSVRLNYWNYNEEQTIEV